jgi:V/A-type H+-transporting ATPase subunit K
MDVRVWIGVMVAVAVLLAGATAGAQTNDAEKEELNHGTKAMTEGHVNVYKSVGLAAAAAFTMAVSVVGAGLAVGRIGAAALGAAAEKPELLTRSVLLVALAEGLAVLGFAIAMMLVQKMPTG